MEPIPAVIRIEDYKLEELLRCPERFAGMKSGRKQEKRIGWRQLAQYAASHSVNDFFMLPREARTRAALEAAIGRRWTNRIQTFHSNEHYLQMKHTVADRLARFLVEKPVCCEPMIVFEQLTSYVEELDLELSQIFHLISACEGGSPVAYKVVKFVANADEDTLELLFHMTSVFGMSAFGSLPACIEVVPVLEEGHYLFRPDEETLEQSMDYMYLVKSLLPQADVFKVNPVYDIPYVM